LTVTLPLTALLSRALVAFTVEFDNEFEQRMPHRTTTQKTQPKGPWLVSMAMWANFMRYLGNDRTPLTDVADLVPLVNLAGLQRWGYVTVDGTNVTPTRAGRNAQDLPVIAVNRPSRTERLLAEHHRDDADQDPPVLMARALMTLWRAFDQQSRLPLPISANLLRVLDEPAVRLRDVPELAGVAKEQVDLSVAFLERHECLSQHVENRTRYAAPTAKGRRAQDQYTQIMEGIDDAGLRAALGRLDRLDEGLRPYPGGWRARLKSAGTLPHCPIVSHRGGYPDGS
jgi:hypothetical protein